MKRRDFAIRWGLLTAWLVAATVLAPAERAFAQEDAKPEMAADAPDDADAKMEKASASSGGATSKAMPLLSFSAGELSVLRRLAERRQALEEREARLLERERLAAAFEARLAEQAKELMRLKEQLAAVEAEISSAEKAKEDAEQARIKNLASAYKTMKARDAARLFDDMEMPLLKAIAREISPRVLAPVLAKMNPEKAQRLTAALRRG